MAITLADFNKIWASTSPLTPYSFSESNYKQGWNFIGSTPPARQMWDFLQKNNDEKMQYLANNYLPLSGGTMSGVITTSNYTLARKQSSDKYLEIDGGTNSSDGAHLILFGKDESRAGAFWITAKDSTNTKQLIGKPDGTLTWDGKLLSAPSGRILTASGTVDALQNSYVDITSVVLDKSISDKWFVFGHVRLSADINDVIAMRLAGGSSSTIRFNGTAGGGAVNGIVVQNITSNTTYILSAYTVVSTQFNYTGTMWAIPLM